MPTARGLGCWSQSVCGAELTLLGVGKSTAIHTNACFTFQFHRDRRSENTQPTQRHSGQCKLSKNSQAFPSPSQARTRPSLTCIDVEGEVGLLAAQMRVLDGAEAEEAVVRDLHVDGWIME